MENKKINFREGLTIKSDTLCPFCKQPYLKNNKFIDCCEKAEKVKLNIKKKIYKDFGFDKNEKSS